MIIFNGLIFYGWQLRKNFQFILRFILWPRGMYPDEDKILKIKFHGQQSHCELLNNRWPFLLLHVIMDTSLDSYINRKSKQSITGLCSFSNISVWPTQNIDTYVSCCVYRSHHALVAID